MLSAIIFTNCSANYTVKVDSAAVTIPPLSQSICTCLCWLSTSDVAIGHSNGFLAIYSIAPHAVDLTGPSAAPNSPAASERIPKSQRIRPWLTFRLHLSYVISLTCAYPSSSTLIASTTVEGHSRLTSLMSPHSSFVETRRTHLVPATMVYHHSLFGFLFPDDTREQVCFTAVRSFGSVLGAAEATGQGTMLSLDVGKVHSAVVFGTADGRVVVTNPMRKILKTRDETAWQQTIFRNEWVRKHESAVTTNENSEPAKSTYAGPESKTTDLKMGISRITESYKVQMADVQKYAAIRASVNSGTRATPRTTVITTISEEETGVTSVCWNPNLRCGGWVAAAWGNGLVRVQDVAI